MAFKITREGNYFVVLNTDNDQLDKYPGNVHVDISNSAADVTTKYTLRWFSGDRSVKIAEGFFSDFLDSDDNPFVDAPALDTFIDENATFTPSGGNNPLKVEYANYLPLFDAAGKMRVSSPTTLVDLQQINDDAPLLYDRVEIGGATQVYSNPDGGTVMSVTNTGDKAIAQQKFFNHYFAGKSQDSLYTGIDFAPQTDVIKRMGYFSTSTVSPYSANRDGIYLESSGGVVFWVVEKNGIETLRVAQSSWNINTLSGQDWDNFNVITFDFLYLGGTGVLFYVFNGREKAPVHVFEHAGLFPSTILNSPSQPVRYEIESTGGAGSMTQVCAEVQTENSITEVGRNNTFAAFDFQANTAGNIYAVLGLRLKSTNRNNLVLIDRLNFMAETNDDVNWILCFNPTITGPAITFGNTDAWGTVNDSVLEVATGTGGAAGGANIITDVGTRIISGSFNGNTFTDSPARNALKLGSLINGTMDEVWIGFQPVSNGLDIFPHINVEEF